MNRRKRTDSAATVTTADAFIVFPLYFPDGTLQRYAYWRKATATATAQSRAIGEFPTREDARRKAALLNDADRRKWRKALIERIFSYDSANV